MRNYHTTAKSTIVRLICVLGLIVTNISASLIIPSASVSPVSAQSASVQRADAVVLVNSASDGHADFQRFVQPYLNNFGIPYSVLDIATTSVGADLADYAVIIVGHRRLDVSQAYLNATEQNNIVTAVNAGTGLVNFDNDLSVGGSTPRYQFVDDIFGFGYLPPPSASDVTFSAVSHYITERHQAGEVITTTTMTLAGITLPTTATSLATSGTQPVLAVTTYGAGHAVQWGTYNWMSHAVKGPMYGLDDLVWRSIVWAARKPFVMQGMPPFVTMRIDDVSGPMNWIHIANEVGIKPWVGVFLNNIDETEAADLAALSQAGSATIGIHAFTDPISFYYNQYNGDYPDAVMAANYVTGTQWFASHNITPSTYVVPHHYEIGTNAFGGLSNWGVQFIATHQLPGEPEWAPALAWLQEGPYRLYESGQSTSTRPVYYADYLPIPGHPEYNQQFFNCVTEVRDEQVYEWIPSNDVGASVLHGTRQLRRGLDGMVVPTLFAHQYNMVNITDANWRSIMQGIASNLASYQPLYVTLDNACQYARAMYTSNITTSIFDSASRQITTTLSGQSDMSTKFYLFTEQNSQIQQSFVNVPAFNGSKQVVATFGSNKATPVITWSNPANIVYGTPLGGTQLNATASVPGSWVYTPPAGTVLNASANRPLRADFTPTDTAKYTTATKTVAITVTKATPVITWNNPANIVYGTPLGGTQLNATASAPGSWVYTPPAGTVLNAGANQILHVDFTPTDAANYSLKSKEVLLNVVKADQTITFDPLPDKVIGAPAFVVTATASSGLSVTFTASGDCSVAGSTVTLLRAGTCTVTARQAGNGNYNAAPNVPHTFTIKGFKLYLPLILANSH